MQTVRCQSAKLFYDGALGTAAALCKSSLLRLQQKGSHACLQRGWMIGVYQTPVQMRNIFIRMQKKSWYIFLGGEVKELKKKKKLKHQCMEFYINSYSEPHKLTPLFHIGDQTNPLNRKRKCHFLLKLVGEAQKAVISTQQLPRFRANILLHMLHLWW